MFRDMLLFHGLNLTNTNSSSTGSNSSMFPGTSNIGSGGGNESFTFDRRRDVDVVEADMHRFTVRHDRGFESVVDALTVDEAGFNAAIDEQRSRARKTGGEARRLGHAGTPAWTFVACSRHQASATAIRAAAAA